MVKTQQNFLKHVNYLQLMHEVTISVSKHAKAALVQQVFYIDWTGRHLSSWKPA